ncbi:MAG: 3'-5' exonuclease, partial [Terriglobales bacterium]
LRVATMHRVKGLEFDRILVAGANDGVIPLTAAGQEEDDEVARRNSDMRERSLLYVALTRARKSAVISTSGVPSKFLPKPAN